MLIAENSMLVIKFSSNEKKDENFMTEHVFCLTILKLKNFEIFFEINEKKICRNMNENLKY